MTTVLDASALLAFLQSESGAEQVETALPEAVISSVNWSEVVQKSLAAGVNVNGLREDLNALGLNIVPFTAEDADQAGRLWQHTKALGLSLGDRACLTAGQKLQAPILTADRAWATLGLPVSVQFIR